MGAIRTLVLKSLNQEPNAVQNSLVSLFKIWVGIWLLFPTDSLDQELFNTFLFSPLNEHIIGIILILVGAIETYFFYREDWVNSARVTLPVVMIWTFLAVGYLQTSPESILTTTFSFFAIFAAYKYLYFTYYVLRQRATDLPNNQKIDNI